MKMSNVLLDPKLEGLQKVERRKILQYGRIFIRKIKKIKGTCVLQDMEAK